MAYPASDQKPPCATGCSRAQGPSGASPARSSAHRTPGATDNTSPRSRRASHLAGFSGILQHTYPDGNCTTRLDPLRLGLRQTAPSPRIVPCRPAGRRAGVLHLHAAPVSLLSHARRWRRLSVVPDHLPAGGSGREHVARLVLTILDDPIDNSTAVLQQHVRRAGAGEIPGANHGPSGRAIGDYIPGLVLTVIHDPIDDGAAVL